MLEIEAKVFQEIRSAKGDVSFEKSTALRDIGLTSLELATVIARLELSLDLDPFAELISVTTIRTVGDMVAAYETAAKADGTVPTAPTASLGIERGLLRRKENE